MPFMPAFVHRPSCAQIIARLVMGYSELEFLLALCAGMARAARRYPRIPPPGFHRGIHRARYESYAIKHIFAKSEGAKERMNRAARIMRPQFRSVEMEPDMDKALHAMRDCLRVRNTFAHCHWEQSKKQGLFFINLEEAAQGHGKPNLRNFRHASAATLTEVEDYFWHTFQMLDWLQHAFAVRTGLMTPPEPLRPKRRPVLSPNSTLFPSKDPLGHG